MRIEPSHRASNSAPDRRRSNGADETAAEDTRRETANLPAVRPQDRPQPRPRGSHAPLLAQLIATRLDMPQTRARRRASPETAIGAYEGGARLRPSEPSRLTRDI